MLGLAQEFELKIKMIIQALPTLRLESGWVGPAGEAGEVEEDAILYPVNNRLSKVRTAFQAQKAQTNFSRNLLEWQSCS